MLSIPRTEARRPDRLMSNENAPVNKTTGMERVEQIVDERVEQRLSELGIEIRSDGDSPGLEDIWVAGQPVGRIIESNRKKADSAREQARATGSSGSESEGKDGETGSQSGDLLPIERMAKLREQDKEHPALPSNGRESFERALSIFENFGDWSKKTPKGRTVTSGLRELLGAVTGTRLAWRQVYRAMDALERWTRGAIRHEHTSRHGHVLVADGQVSSAGRGG